MIQLPPLPLVPPAALVLPPLHPLPQMPQLPLPFPPSGANEFPAPSDVTPWFPMRVLPCDDRPGWYDVAFDDATPQRREWWTGKDWPGLKGKFAASQWRGKATP